MGIKISLCYPDHFLAVQERRILKEANLEKKHLQAPEGGYNESDTRAHKDQPVS